jgi:uncharacterized membrane protein YfcA
VVAGLVDSIAGGGGLLTVPVLLGVGLPPAAALGTNKLQASFGSATATWNYHRAGLLALGASLDGVVWTAVGAAAGSVAVGLLSDAWLRRAIPCLLLGALALLVFRPRVAEVPRKPVLGTRLFHAGMGLALGAYDGFFGPGVGALWTLAFLGLRGMDWVRATAHTKLMNCTSNLVALAVFASEGVVCVGPGLVMGLGQWVGARLGARLVISRGARFVRPVFIGMVVAVSLKLLWPSG